VSNSSGFKEKYIFRIIKAMTEGEEDNPVE